MKDGDYMFLFREFLIYRDIYIGYILNVFYNLFLDVLNEVFNIVNDFVNGMFQQGGIVLFKIFLNDVVVFNLDFVLEYFNVLDLDKYFRYLVGKYYNVVEFFFYFVNYFDFVMIK